MPSIREGASLIGFGDALIMIGGCSALNSQYFCYSDVSSIKLIATPISHLCDWNS
jgi:hypothetical protein